MTDYGPYLDPAFLTDLAEIQRLLAEAYEHYMADGDGGWKSSEGHISISFPEFFWIDGFYGENDTLPKPPEVSIYSYALGPSRMHHFKNVTEALAEVRKWHREEMESGD